MISETAVVYPGTELGDGVQLGDHCVVGKPPVLAAGSSAAGEAPPPAQLGPARPWAPGLSCSRGRGSATAS